MNGNLVFLYEDIKGGFLRVKLDLLSSGILQSYVWIPIPSEKEDALGELKRAQGSSEFKTLVEKNEGPDFFEEPVLIFINEKRGVTIRYNKSGNFVEAIARYQVNSRTPSNNN